MPELAGAGQWNSSAFRFAIGLCVGFLGVASARAADIVASRAIDGSNVIQILGDLTKGDADEFNRIAATITGKTVVFLNSGGGSALVGIMIGQSIRSKRYSTAVANNTDCVSACAIIWLAGITRYIGERARVGFHAAYVGRGDDAKESGVGNALVGAYLTQLGFSYRAIIFATVAPPDGINWLQPDDAKRIGIKYSALAEYRPVRPARAPEAVPGIPFIACMALTAAVYHLPPRVLPAIQAVENGRPGMVHVKEDGSEVLGVMQINQRWIGPLASRTGLAETIVHDRLLSDPCFNIAAAGLIMRTLLNEAKGDLMAAVGMYHSDNPSQSQSYQEKVLKAAGMMYGGGLASGAVPKGR